MVKNVFVGDEGGEDEDVVLNGVVDVDEDQKYRHQQSHSSWDYLRVDQETEIGRNEIFI